MGFTRRQPGSLFADTKHFSGEKPGFFVGLGFLRRVALAAFVGGEDVGAGFGVEEFELGDVAVELAGVGAD